MENQVNTHDDEISLKDVILKVKEWSGYLIAKWKVIFLAGCIGGGIGLTYQWLKKPVYIAESTFVLEGNTGGGMGQYSSLASMVGLDIGGGSSSGIFQGDNIFELYKSRLMIEKTLLSFADFNGKRELIIDQYIKINLLASSWNNNPQLKGLSFNIPKEKFSRSQDSIMSKIVEDINNNYLTVEKPDKKLSIISVKVKSGNEIFSKIFTEKIVQTVNNFYVQTKTKNSLQNLQILQRQSDSLKNVLNLSIANVASAVDINPNANTALQMLRVPSQRRQIDVQASSAIYAEIVKQLELAKISLRKESPLIQVVDEPVLPLKKEGIGRLRGLIYGGIIAGVIAVFYLLAKRIIDSIMQ